MTADEFEVAYAARSGYTVARLRELGRIVAPCDCGEEICEGWQSTTQERLDDQAAFHRMTDELLIEIHAKAVHCPTWQYWCADCGTCVNLEDSCVHRDRILRGEPTT